MSNYAIKAEGLHKKYGKFEISGLSLSLPKGCIMGLIGENGAGKSTLIRLLMNACDCDGGVVSLLDDDKVGYSEDDVRQDIGIVIDPACLPQQYNATVLGKVLSGYYKRWDNEAYDKYLDLFEIDRKKKIFNLSTGTKMKLMIATALSHDAKLLILDEPTNGLDPMVREQFLDILSDFTLDPEHSVLISSHIISDLEKICDYVAYMHRGRLKFCDEKDKLLDDYRIVKCSEAQLDDLPKSSCLGAKKGQFGCEVLMKNSEIPLGFTKERTTLEQIILFMARDGKEREQ